MLLKGRRAPRPTHSLPRPAQDAGYTLRPVNNAPTRQIPRVLLPVLTACLIGAMLLGVHVGPVQLPITDVVALLTGGGANVPDYAKTSLLQLRLPRVLLAAMTGASLGICGAAIQGLFRNPLAEPGLIGVSAGAALGAVLVLVMAPALLPGLLVPLLFFTRKFLHVTAF